MPELPEVETVVRTLEHQLGNVQITSCKILWNKIIAYPDVTGFEEKIVGKTINSYQRYGKFLIFDLGDKIWIAHMRMEGKFYVQKPGDVLNKHMHVLINLSDGRQLRYHDTRKFGRMWLYDKIDDISLYPCFDHFGYDVLDGRLTGADLYHQLHHKKTALKLVLLDQSVMAGIGNIYADEICFALGMHPETMINHLRKKDFEELLVQARRILDGAIRSGGTTIRSYTSSLGVDGRFQLKLKVHAKKGEDCSVCGTSIRKIKVGGRGTFFCPKCQKRK